MTAGALTCVFCGLNTNPYLPATHMRLLRWASCSALVWPWTVMSSEIPMHPWHCSRDLVHLLLEDVLTADKAKRKMQEMVPSKGDCWRLWVGWIPDQEWSTSIHARHPTWWSSESAWAHVHLPPQWASCGDHSRWSHWGHGDLNIDIAHHLSSRHRWLRTPSPWAHLLGWSLPGVPSCWGSPWHLNTRWWSISRGCVSWDEHHDRVRLCTCQEIYQFLWTDLETPSSSHQWILMGLAAAGAAVGLTAVALGAGTGLGGFVVGWITVMAQFIFTTTSLSHDGRPRMAGPGVSVTYQ